MTVSVVVPTRDRPAALERCLAALARQTVSEPDVVVVDDGSADAGAVLAAVARSLPSARVVRGSGRGPAAARNLGARAARGSVICFTDDDCAPVPRWAGLLAAACGGGGAAAGMTLADPVAGKPAEAAQLLTHSLQVASLGSDRSLGFAPTCNLACTAEIARRLPFDESFALAAGEDRDWCARLAQTGARLLFVPEARVLHRPQLGLPAMLAQQLRYGRGAVGFRGTGGRLAGGAFYGRIVRESARAGPRVAGLVVLAQAAVVVGAAQELASRRAGGTRGAA